MVLLMDKEEKAMLEEVILKRRPDLAETLKSVGLVPLTEEQREELRETLASELVATGLEADSEPNARGLFLEGLTDRLGYL